jgi:hypothetical protein
MDLRTRKTISALTALLSSGALEMPAVRGVDPFVDFCLRASIDSRGDFAPGTYRWLREEATVEEAAALLYAVGPAVREGRQIFASQHELLVRAEHPSAGPR